MALKTLKEVVDVDGVNVVHFGSGLDTNLPKESYIVVDHDANAITFKIQDGPIKEQGANGCQVDQMIEVCMMIIEGLNEEFPCFENDMAITALDQTLHWLKKRTAERRIRGVEGKSMS